MAEEDAHELLACTVEQRQLSEPDTSLDLVQTMPLTARRSLSHFGIDSGCHDLSRENNSASEASQSNPVIAGEEESSHSIVEIAADNMKEEICSQLKEVQVQPKMIYRVRQINRRLDKDAYDPQFISFGFYHSDSEAFWLADKWSFLEQILNTYEDKDDALKMYLEEMDGVKQEVKDYYEGNIPIDTPNGIKMLLLDGCFILGFLGLLPLPYGPYQEYEFSLLTLWNHSSIRHDLFLMENQLPFTVLKRIYDLATPERTDVSEAHPLIEQVDKTINKLLRSYPFRTNGQQFHHLLHCCHMKFKPAMTTNSEPIDKPERKWRGATDLYKAGIKFMPKLSDPEFSLLDVQLVSRRTLMIPTLIIEDNTISIFRNLIAFEQLCSNEDYFVAYVFFMGALMSTPGDVTLLVKEGVVKNYIGTDKEISAFFNNLIKGVIFEVDGEHFLCSTFKKLNGYYNSVGNKYLADLKQNYCGSPWLAISMVAAAILLISTLVQTVFAVIK